MSKSIAQPQQKNSGYTFFESFLRAIQDYEEKYQNTPKSDVESFGLYEDLKVLLELSKIPSVDMKSFDHIAQVLKRSRNSLYERYQQYLKNIQFPDLTKIREFIQQYQLDGYIVFKVQENKWMLSEIRPNHPKESLRTPVKVVSSIINEDQSQIKKLKLTHPYQLSAQSKYDISAKKIKLNDEKPVLTANQKEEVQELKFNLKILAEWMKVPLQEIVQRLYQCSGDLEQLVHVYTQQKENELWTKEGDEALEAYVSGRAFDQEALKAVLGGDEIKIENRRQWLQI